MREYLEIKKEKLLVHKLHQIFKYKKLNYTVFINNL